jgi:chemotaxis protein methyltransferase CheR
MPGARRRRAADGGLPRGDAGAPGAWSDAGFAAVAAALAAHAGLKIPPHRYPELEAAARRSMRAAGIASAAEYALRLGEGRLSLADLVGAFTVGETFFFRDKAQFDLIRSRVVREVRARRPPGHLLRAWSAGCASGEEAWSIALALEREAPDGCWHVLGTDISRPSLAKARTGRYGEWSLRGPGRREALRGLVVRGGRWDVAPRLRPRVRFEYLNLAEDAYPSFLTATVGLDLILCRNVLIYFERDVVEAVARRLHACLAPGGWLVTGVTDPPLGALAPFETISTEAGVLYRRPAASSRAVGRGAGAGAGAGPDPSPNPDPSPGPSPSPSPSPSPGPGPGPGAALPSAHDTWEEVLSRADALLDSPEGAAALVRAGANAGDLGRADELAARAAERHPLLPELHLLRASILSDLARDSDALAALRRCLYLDRGLAVAHAAMGALLARGGDLEGARRAWRNVRRICAAVPADSPLPLGDGQCAGRLSEIASAQLSMLGGGDIR